MLQKEFILVLFIVLYSINVKGQTPGFLGKKFNMTFGVALNPKLISVDSDNFLNDEMIFSVLPPKFDLHIEYCISNRSSFNTDVSFFLMPHNLFYVENNIYNDYNNQELTVDTFLLKTELYSLALGFRTYKEYAPSWKYYSYGIAGNYFNTTIYPTTYKYSFVNNTTVERYIEKRDIGTQFTYNISIFLGYGKQVIINEKYTFDYGFKIYSFLGKWGYGRSITDENFDHRENLRPIVDYIMNKRAFETHIFQPYIALGLLK